MEGTSLSHQLSNLGGGRWKLIYTAEWGTELHSAFLGMKQP